jgi:uncharacterized membrane protein YccC
MTEVASWRARLRPGSGSARTEHDNDSQVAFSLLALSGWTFALRTWIATMAALYVAFWLQLGNAYSAAVCVAILALPTRGQAYEKAVYRIGGTIIGFLASLAIVGPFNGTRDLFILAFATWMAVCGYVASFLDGNRAYGAVLSGFTAAIVAFANIDTPQSVFSVGMDRCATILVGVVAVMVVNDLFSVPEAFPNLARRLEETHHRIIVFVKKMLSARNMDLSEIGDILKTITAFRVDVAMLPTESIAGRNRAVAARAAIAAMVRQVVAARTIGAILHEYDDKRAGLVDAVVRVLDQTAAEEENGNSRIVHCYKADSPLFLAAGAALVLRDQNGRALSSFDRLQTGNAMHGPVLPLFRAREAAFRNALRLFLAILIASYSLSLSGWPAVSNVMLMFAAVIAIGTNAASPKKFAKDALVAILLAFAVSGITEFVILDGVDSFPLLAIGLAPAIIGPCLLVSSGNPKIAPVGTLMLIFTPLLLLVSNPPNYDPRIYLIAGSLNIISIIFLFITTTVLLPTNDDRKRSWLLRSLRRDFRLALGEKPLPYDVDGAAFRDADREVQLNALRPNTASEDCGDWQSGLRWVELTSAAWRMRLALRDLHQNLDIEEEGRLALATADSVNLRLLADRLLTQKDPASENDFEEAREAAAAMAWMALLIERNPHEIVALNKGHGR